MTEQERLRHRCYRRRYRAKHLETARAQWRKDARIARQRHPEKHAAQNKAWREANPEAMTRSRRLASWKKHGIVGMTLERYDQLLEDQDGLCKTCGAYPGKQRFDVDHDHETGEVRALLCRRCNIAMGYLEDPLFKRWQAYLAEHGQPAKRDA